MRRVPERAGAVGSAVKGHVEHVKENLPPALERVFSPGQHEPGSMDDAPMFSGSVGFGGEQAPADMPATHGERAGEPPSPGES